MNKRVIESLSKLKNDILNRDLSCTKIKQNSDIIYLDSIEDDFFNSEEQKINLKNESDFSIYFRKLFENYKSLVEKDKENKCELVKNEFYNPHVFEIISKRLYLVPLWSGLIISLNLDSLNCSKTNSRLSNNPVESWFNILRNNILQLSKKQKVKRKIMPSEFSCLLYSFLSYKYKKYYMDDAFNSNIKLLDSNMPREKWDTNANESTREKGFYYKDNSDFITFDQPELDSNIDKITNSIFKESFTLGKYEN